MASTTAPASIAPAVAFLTRPLILALAPVRVAALQLVLRNTLAAAFAPLSPGFTLVLPFAPNRLPPRPVYAACVAAGVPWAEWMALLATREFVLVVGPRAVRVEYAGLHPRRVVIWEDATPAITITPATTTTTTTAAARSEERQVPISKFAQHAQTQAQTPARTAAALRATLASALARAQGRTAAQCLLDATHDADAAELFARLSLAQDGVLSPSPTREAFALPARFAGFPAPLSSPESETAPAMEISEESESEGSRPSSRSSHSSAHSSTGSLSSTFSAADDASVSSASSVGSLEELMAAVKLPSNQAVAAAAPVTPWRAPIFVPGARARAERAAARLVPVPVHARVLPVPTPARAPAAEPKVVIDTNKKDVTKYLYQGGVSTVLTGGVMLGAGAAPKGAKAAPAPAPQVARYRAPIGSRPAAANARNNNNNNNNKSEAASWRRAAPAFTRA